MYDFSRLLNRMERKGISQRKLAASIGISANAFNNKIKGRSFFNAQEIELICDVLAICQADIGMYFFSKTKNAPFSALFTEHLFSCNYYCSVWNISMQRLGEAFL